MRERPILFSAPMVRALLDGTKTQTRRIVKPQPECFIGGQGVTDEHGRPVPRQPAIDEHTCTIVIRCPYGQPGDRLWVRETWAHHVHAQSAARDQDGPFVYAADGQQALSMRLPSKWTPGIHMFRWASRITLEVTGVRVERLQDISEKDAQVEGADISSPVGGVHGASYRAGYRLLWEDINGPGSWDANPWVWVVEFKRLEP